MTMTVLMSAGKKLFSVRGAAVAATLGAAAIGMALQSAGSAAAASAAPLTPAPGAVSFGSGTASVDTSGGSLVVRIDIAGVRPGATYRVSACADVAGALNCASNPATDMTVADPFGGVHGSFVTPMPLRTDVVTLTNVFDASDGYQAWFDGAPAFVPPVALPVTPVVAPVVNPIVPSLYGFRVLANGVVVPAGSTVTPLTVCPPGYFGPMTVRVGVNGVTPVTYPLLYPWLYNNLPAASFTTTVSCTGL